MHPRSSHSSPEGSPGRSSVSTADALTPSPTARVPGALSDRVAHPAPLTPSAQDIDPLTGLLNRTGLHHHLREHLSASPSSLTALLHLDLDRFTRVNDSLGHSQGDALLVQVAQALCETTDEKDLVARIEGDTFAIGLPDLDAPDAAHEVARRIHDRLQNPFQIDGTTVFAPASIGLVVDLAAYDDVATVLRNADTALHEAKDAPHEPYAIYDASMTHRAHAKLSLDAELRQALDRGDFVPFFQPIVTLSDGSLHGFEVLARWRHPERGLLSPHVFLDAAEETGLIVPIGHQVIRKACDIIDRLRRRDPHSAPILLTANFSRQEFFRPETHDFLTNLLATYDEVSPADFTMEISERTVAEISNEDVTNFRALKDLGVHIILDDFGTGFSSLQSVRRLPIDGLKIDKDLLADTDDTPWNRDLIEIIVEMGHTLGQTVTAEGIERIDQLNALRDIGCSYGQGFLFARPRPASDLNALLDEPFQSQFWTASQHGA